MAAYPDPPRYGLRIITPPTAEPVQLGEAMEHLNIEMDDRRMDDWINRNIPTARRYCEGYLGRCLAPQTLEISFGGQSVSTALPTYWQPVMLNPLTESAIELPYGPVVSITSVVYRDSAGDEQTVDAADYELDGWADVPVVSLASGASWPSVRAGRNAIQIRYVAGYTFPDDSPSPYPLPSEFRSAMLLMLAHLYKNREATAGIVGATLEQIPLGIQSLMDLSPAGRLRLGMA